MVKLQIMDEEYIFVQSGNEMAVQLPSGKYLRTIYSRDAKQRILETIERLKFIKPEYFIKK